MYSNIINCGIYFINVQIYDEFYKLLDEQAISNKINKKAREDGFLRTGSIIDVDSLTNVILESSKNSFHASDRK